MGHQIAGPNVHLSEIIRGQFPEGYVGHGIDVGASDGISINSTYMLEKDHQWNIISVEPNIEFAKSLRYQRAFVEFCACSNEPGRLKMHINDDNPEAYSSLNPTKRKDLPGIDAAQWRIVEVKVETVDRILRKWDFPKLDFICVDTEGTEKDVLEGAMLEKWKPKVIVSESWDEDGGQVRKYLKEHGYERMMRHVHNDIYRRIG